MVTFLSDPLLKVVGTFPFANLLERPLNGCSIVVIIVVVLNCRDVFGAFFGELLQSNSVLMFLGSSQGLLFSF